MSSDSKRVNYHFSTDEDRGILSVVASGFWTAEMAYRYIADIEREAALARSRFGKLRLLVDASATEVQAQEVIAIFAGFENKILKYEEDRAAMIAKSTLSKMQIERSFSSKNIMAFPDQKAADVWLLSDKQGE